MNIEIPQKQFTKEEINRCYIRWQQLRNEHGENAPNVPEFIFLTKTLQVAARQQQELQQRNNLNNNSGNPDNNNSNSSSNRNNGSVMDNNKINKIPSATSGMNPDGQYINSNLSQTVNIRSNRNDNVVTSPAERNVDVQMNANDIYRTASNLSNNILNTPNYVPQTKTLSLDEAVSPKTNSGNTTLRNMPKDSIYGHVQDNNNNNNNNNSPRLNKQPSQKMVYNQTQQQASQNVPTSQNSQQTTSHPNIFTPSQSNLLRAQITALKCLVNHQNVPIEYQAIIHQSVSHPPDFKKMLISLSEYLRMKKAYEAMSASPKTNLSSSMNQNLAFINQKSQVVQSPVNVVSNGPLSADHINNIPKPQSSPNQEISQINKGGMLKTTKSPRANKIKINNTGNNMNLGSEKTKISKFAEREIPSKNAKDENTPVSSNQEVLDKMHSRDTQSKISTEIQRKIIENQEPPEPAPPIPLDEFRKKNDMAEKIIEIEDPDIMVDSYSLPSIINTEVAYESLFPKDPTDFTIIPSLLPEGIDTHTTAEIYQTLIALNLDTAVNDCLAILLDDKVDKITKDKAMVDYRALQLLPLQKAVRGHVLQFEWYQNSLLTNTHPNFLSKIRDINIQDTLLTEELYRKHELQQYERRKRDGARRLEFILDRSIKQFNGRLENRSRRIKFGHKLITLHGNLEKEEQKRQERKAKERLQALKANDEEAYIKLLDQTKDTRITHLLRQTNEFLESLTNAVKDQQNFTKSMIESHLKKDGDESSTSATPASSVSGENELINVDVEEQENADYYNVAHRIKEEIKQQPSILVGGTLKEYQIKGLQWMVSLFNNHLNGILADEMGLGKTIQTISLLTYLYEVKKVHGPFLVIVPLSTLSNWSNEFAKWAPTLRTVSFKGTPAERKLKQATIRSGNFDVVLTTFEYIIKEKALLSKIKWVHMIIDEGHRMKNAQSKLSLTLNTYYHSDYRLILTGTPLQNNLPELWALLNFVLPKIFNSVQSFDEWFNTPFANTGGQDKIELSEEETLLVIRRLHKVLRPFLLRRLKKDVEKDLPDKVEKVIKCKMSALQQIMYQQMLKHRRLYVGDHTNKKMVGLRGFNNQLMQLKKICNHPFVFEEVEDQINPTRETNFNIWRVAGKFELLERVLPKLKATGHRVLIFFQMTQIMDIMEDFLRFMDIKYLRLDGHTKSDERSVLLRLFNDPESEYFCFILSTRAGGLGLNLQTADTVIIFDTDWNPHQDLQAQDRAHRIGQKNEVRILRLITEHSVEEAILERAHKKLDIDGKVIQAGKFDNKSTAEEQEALLRSLLEAEEDRRRRREAGDLEEDELNDSEINELLARDDNELAIFSNLDNERAVNDSELGIKTRLFDISELPDIYTKEIPTEEEVKENETLKLSEGRSSRDRKKTVYNDDLTEEQWLKQFEITDDENDDDDEIRGGRKRKGQADNSSYRVKQAKLENNGDGIIPETPLTIAGTPEGSMNDHATVYQEQQDEEGAITTAGKTSIKSARTSTKTRASKSTRGRGKGRGRGRPSKNKNGLHYIRVLDNTALPLVEREAISSQAELIYDFALNHKNELGRLLSPIFMERPPKTIYPDYYLLIKYPCAFENIRYHIDNKLYNSLFEIVEDFHLIFSNARVYNTEDSVIYNDSLELENQVIQKYQEITNDTKPIDFSVFDSKFASTPLIIPSNVNTSVASVANSPIPCTVSPSLE
ncbi:hypothetical protein RI543_002592 [Arxiozyma heterogenica]|uniref:Uncharacterized protein n=1 Tax=Arxiozyma heterogenica TaxID=278026 RepID=A0AAN7WQT1_9SACH|nr:hypothetical protein RI543_002592 [Kazachstania heterogenica]